MSPAALVRTLEWFEDLLDEGPKLMSVDRSCA
jgi:hypothetical protein